MLARPLLLAALAFPMLAACRDPGPTPAATSAPSAAGSTAPPAPAPSSTAAPSASSASTRTEERCSAGRIFIPAGRFRMGSPPEDRDADPDERPVREVRLGAYCMDRTEVTVASYARCVAAGACTRASPVVVSRGLGAADIEFWSRYCNAGQPGRDDHPVNCVDWRQAGAYCAWAGGRLPTEAEWEHAARGDDGRAYPWGNEKPSASRLNACGAECKRRAADLGRKDGKTMFEGDDGAESTAPVGRYPEGRSPFGVLDMAGNVWEWTADGYAPYDPAQTEDPKHEAGPARVVRGGHWLNVNPLTPRAANRESRPEEKRLEDVGFRCVAAPAGG